MLKKVLEKTSDHIENSSINNKKKTDGQRLLNNWVTETEKMKMEINTMIINKKEKGNTNNKEITYKGVIQKSNSI